MKPGQEKYDGKIAHRRSLAGEERNAVCILEGDDSDCNRWLAATRVFERSAWRPNALRSKTRVAANRSVNGSPIEYIIEQVGSPALSRTRGSDTHVASEPR